MASVNPFAGVEKYLAKFDEFKLKVADVVAKHPEFCSDLMLQRYLVAREGSVRKANEALRETITWREQWKVIVHMSSAFLSDCACSRKPSTLRW